MTRSSLLKRRDAPPPLRRIRFSVPETDAKNLDALIDRARAAGFDVDLQAALVDAYGRIAQRLARELGDDDKTGAVDDAESGPAAVMRLENDAAR